MRPQEGMSAGVVQIFFYDPEVKLQLRTGRFEGLDAEILQSLQDMIHSVNPFAIAYRSAALALSSDPTTDWGIIIHAGQHASSGTSADRSNTAGGYHYGRYLQPVVAGVAAIVPNLPERLASDPAPHRDIVITERGGGLIYINEQHPSYDPLHYVLMFPFGEQGWTRPSDNRASQVTLDSRFACPSLWFERKSTSFAIDQPDNDDEYYPPMKFYAYMLQVRDESYIRFFARLLHQYIVDMYAKIELHRLSLIILNQHLFRAEILQGLADIHGGESTRNIGRTIILYGQSARLK